MAANIRCNLCGADNAEFLHTRKFDNGVLHNYVKCRRCGFVYVNPLMSEKELAKFYEDDYYVFDEIYDRLNKENSVRDFEDIRKVVGLGKKRILDIGCAKGFLLNAAKKAGWEAYGLDISEPAAAIARKKFGLDVFTGSIESAPYKNEFFDVVCAFDYLEHVRNPCKALRKMSAMLRKGGTLVIEAPNIESIYYKMTGKYWSVFNPFHIYHFTPKTLSAMMKKSGLEPVKITTPNVNLFSTEGLIRSGLLILAYSLLSKLGLKNAMLRIAGSKVGKEHGKEVNLNEKMFKSWAVADEFEMNRHVKGAINFIPNLLFGNLLKMGDSLKIYARKT